MTAISLPEKKKPSQVAQEETPWPINACSEGSPSHRAEAPLAMISVRVRIGFGTQVQQKGPLREVGRDQMGHAELRAKAGGLLLHVLDELGTLNAVGPAGKVLHQRGDGKLAAGLVALQNQRFQIGARGVDSCGEPGAAGAQNDCVTNVVCHDLYLCIFDSRAKAWIHEVTRLVGRSRSG